MTITHASILDAIAFAALAPRRSDAQGRKDALCEPRLSRGHDRAYHLFGFDDSRMLVAAVLHDTIEDTKTDFDDLEVDFGREIAEWVGHLTKNKALPETDAKQITSSG